MRARSAAAGQRRGGPAPRVPAAVLGVLALGACALLPFPSAAQMVTNGGGGGPLDRCSVIVTGTDMRSRPAGMAQCLHRVLVKVSGDPALADDPRVDGFAPDPAALAEDIAYFDRMSDIPHHDEQGSRDRPFDLAVDFDPARIDAILAELGVSPWRVGRPALVAVLAVRDRQGGRYTLSGDGEDGESQREALFAAAGRFGMRVVLPLERDTTARGATAATVAAETARRVRSVPSAALTGSLVWSDPDAGWVGTWHVAYGTRERSWSIRGVSFDEAFRSAVGGAAAALSGHDAPAATLTGSSRGG